MATMVTAMKESLDKALRDENKPWTKLFATAEAKTGFDRLYIVIGILALLTLYLLVGVGQQLICNIIGFVYPAYCSMKALESRNKDDDTKWLTYWVVFAVFTIVEFFSEYIVCWCPMYWLLKCILHVWLMAPIEYNGSLILYHRFIRPQFVKYEPNIDNLLSNARDAAVKAASDAILNQKKD
ncbi:receptor expression-enhancing protein 5-like [Venturia canescens]|uniref:receptor expression-enhancing protein 5-like n=1 Tax=Venturia canescens TaxID=32260 RepID=UPI001C9BF7EF|nr:receptor expression-enhancing protein 5-like [Venturia canescens]